MREILFGGKRIDNGEWAYGGYRKEKIGEYPVAVFIIEHLTSGVYENHRVDHKTVGQYTGLRDSKRTKEYSNGQMIFEGDIVTHYINWLGERIKGVVEYDTKLASWMCRFGDDKEKESAFLCDWVDNNGCEVIGNIHDNPELLKAGDDNA